MPTNWSTAESEISHGAEQLQVIRQRLCSDEGLRVYSVEEMFSLDGVSSANNGEPV